MRFYKHLRRSTSVLITAAIILVAGSVALAATSEPSTKGRAVPPDEQIPAQAKADKTSDAQRKLGVLRRVQNAADAPDAGARTAIDQGLLGENSRLARKALTTDFGREYYVAPGRGGVVCLAWKSGSICGAADQAEQGRLSGTEACAPNHPDRYVIFGMLPDGPTEVRLHLEDGSTLTAPVHANVYAIAVRRDAPRPTQLRWGEGSTAGAAPAPVDGAIPQTHCG